MYRLPIAPPMDSSDTDDLPSQCAIELCSVNAPSPGSSKLDVYGAAASQSPVESTRELGRPQRFVLYTGTLSAAKRFFHSGVTSLELIRVAYPGSSITAAGSTLLTTLADLPQLQRLIISNSLPRNLGQPGAPGHAVSFPQVHHLALEDVPSSCEHFLRSISIPAATSVHLRLTGPIASADAARSLADALKSTGLFRMGAVDHPFVANAVSIDTVAYYNDSVSLRLQILPTPEEPHNLDAHGPTNPLLTIIFPSSVVLETVILSAAYLPLHRAEHLVITPRQSDRMADFYWQIIDSAFPSIRGLTVGRPLFSTACRALAQAGTGVVASRSPRYLRHCSMLTFIGLIYPDCDRGVYTDVLAQIRDVRGALDAPVSRLAVHGTRSYCREAFSFVL